MILHHDDSNINIINVKNVIIIVLCFFLVKFSKPGSRNVTAPTLKWGSSKSVLLTRPEDIKAKAKAPDHKAKTKASSHKAETKAPCHKANNWTNGRLNPGRQKLMKS